jgi:hypothetical protein
VVLGAAYLNVLNSYQVAERRTQDDDAVDFARSQLLTHLGPADGGDGPGVRRRAAPREVDGGDRPHDTTDLFTVTFTCVVSAPAPDRRLRSRPSC